MSLSIDINAAFKIDNVIYTANMALPTTSPTADAPFLFFVTSAESSTPSATTTLLTVAVGASQQVYVAVAPPTDLIESAVGSDIVQQLNVVVEEGTYDPTTHKFTA